MNSSKVLSLVVVGVLVGFLIGHLQRPEPAMANPAMPMSLGDTTMMDAMRRMDATMKTAHLDGEQDHDFMLLMIAHHQAAIDMARVELMYGIHPQLKTLAKDIISAQTREIAQMHLWHDTWYGRQETH